MIPLKDAIATKHREAERKPFNVRMIRGELTSQEYLVYLHQLYHLFTVLERHQLPHPTLYRMEHIIADIRELTDTTIQPTAFSSTTDYCEYLSHLSVDQILPHIYLHYLALLYGGQMMRNHIPGSGMLYAFDAPADAIHAIRTMQQDEWADEANKGLDYFMRILDELHNVSGSGR